MKTSFDILSRIYAILNVSTVTSLLNAGIWRRSKPVSSNGRYITINTISPKSGDYPLQEGTVLINAYATDNPDGTPDETTLKSIADAVIALIEAYNAASEYFTLTVGSENVFPDDSNPNVSYLSLRVNYLIEK